MNIFDNILNWMVFFSIIQRSIEFSISIAQGYDYVIYEQPLTAMA